MATYCSYHSDLKLAANLGVLNAELARTIPASTLHRFRTSDYSRLFGLSIDLAEAMHLVKKFAHNERAQAFFRAALRVKTFLVSVLSAGRSVVRVVAKHKDRVVRLVERVSATLGERCTLRLLGLTKTRFSRWRTQLSRRCPVSLRSLCLRSHPHQLSSREIASIARIIHNDRFQGWPAVSVYWKTVREGHFGFALSTFYKYVKLLGLSRSRPASRRKDHAQGVRASRPNELWHADVTVFTTMDRIKAYIYLVVDNFSRRILSWDADTSLSAQVHVATVREAYHKFITVGNAKHSDEVPPLLMTDGGPENVEDPAIPIDRLIAGQDVRYSNSLVESVNKIVKYQSLYLTDIPDIAVLQRHLARWIPIYNNERPHCAHRYLTPTEVHEGARPSTDRFTKQFHDARMARVEANRIEPCPICSPHEVNG